MRRPPTDEERLNRWKIRALISMTIMAMTVSAAVASSFTGVKATLGPSVGFVPGAGCTQVPPNGWSPETPYPRFASAVAYDAESGQTYALLFGGAPSGSNTPLGDTWEYANGCWTRYCTSACTVGTSEPSARFGESMAYDTQDHEFVLFGGCTVDYNLYLDTCVDSTSDILGDTWVWSGSCAAATTSGCWSKLAATISPDPNGYSALYGAKMVYDPNTVGGQCGGSGGLAAGTGCVLLWGGSDYWSTDTSGPCHFAHCNADGWYFHAGTWTSYAAMGTFYQGAWGSAAYVPTLGEVFNWGGEDYNTAVGNDIAYYGLLLFYTTGGNGAWTSISGCVPSAPTPANACPWAQVMGAAVYDTSSAGQLGGSAPAVVLFDGDYATPFNYPTDTWTYYWYWSPGGTAGGAGSWGNYYTLPDPAAGPAAFFDPGRGYVVSVGGYDNAIGDNLGVEIFN